MTIIVDDAYIEQEERHRRAARARVIEKHGSMERYDQHCLSRVRQVRAARWCSRRDRVMSRRPSQVAHHPLTVRRAESSGRPAARTGASSSTSSSDPGGDDPSPSPWVSPAWPPCPGCGAPLVEDRDTGDAHCGGCGPGGCTYWGMAA